MVLIDFDGHSNWQLEVLNTKKDCYSKWIDFHTKMCTYIYDKSIMINLIYKKKEGKKGKKKYYN